jgi:hypothetical protein
VTICAARDIPLTTLERDILADLTAAAARISAEADLTHTAMTPQPSRPTCRRPARPRLVAAGVAVAVTAGGIAAAAAGVVPNPWAGPTVLNEPIVTASDPAAVAGATVQLAAPGPESVTFQVITAAYTRGGIPGQCTSFVAKEPQGQPEHLLDGCGQTAAVLPDGQTQRAATQAAAAFNTWQAPSGAIYAVIEGTAAAEATRVVLTDVSGNTIATGPAANGYYVTYLPARDLPTQTVLDEYDSTGRLLDAQNLGSDSAPTP